MLYYNVLYIEWFWDNELIYALGPPVVNQPLIASINGRYQRRGHFTHADVPCFWRFISDTLDRRISWEYLRTFWGIDMYFHGYMLPILLGSRIDEWGFPTHIIQQFWQMALFQLFSSWWSIKIQPAVSWSITIHGGNCYWVTSQD
jgi:hypothetical protein